MIANSSEHQGMIPGKTDYQFSFSTTDFIKRFGATQNKELKFKGHFSALRKKKKKNHHHFSVLTRFGKLISARIFRRLYKASMV